MATIDTRKAVNMRYQLLCTSYRNEHELLCHDRSVSIAKEYRVYGWNFEISLSEEINQSCVCHFNIYFVYTNVPRIRDRLELHPSEGLQALEGAVPLLRSSIPGYLVGVRRWRNRCVVTRSG